MGTSDSGVIPAFRLAKTGSSFATAVYVVFCKNRVHMGLYRARGYAKVLGNFLIGIPPVDQTQDLTLARCQPDPLRAILHLIRDSPGIRLGHQPRSIW